MSKLNRRQFLLGMGAGLAFASLPGGLTRLAFASSPNSQERDTLLVVFLRGGCDGLSLVPPVDGADRGHYEMARPSLQIPLGGSGAALPLKNSSGRWGLHPLAAELHDLYNDDQLAIILGTGMAPPVTRSHFDAQITMELGTPGQSNIGSGWLTRHLSSMNLPSGLIMPGVSAGSLTATSLLASTDTITMGSGSDFRVDTSAWGWNAADRYDPPPPGFAGLVETLPEIWAGSGSLEQAGQRTLDSLAVVRPMDFGNYAPANGATYPDSGFARQLQMLAQLIKADLGLTVATIESGGDWDTHYGQPYRFNSSTTTLSQGLAAFWQDLSGSGNTDFAARTTVLVVSEFGRRVRENDSSGTDHGRGNVMFALGGAVNGGQVHGLNEFAGLADGQLYEGEDVDVTIDWRRILSEAMIRRQRNNRLGLVFPGYQGYQPLGVFQGSDLPPDYTGEDDLIFQDRFG